jgi:uncharacterized protein
MRLEHYDAGTPCWVDLCTTDTTAAAGFYRALFGWDTGPAEEDTHRMCDLDGAPVAGMMIAGDGVPVAWNTFVAVDDADATTRKVGAAGGQTIQEPVDVGPHGRLAVYADPAGQVISAWQPKAHPGALRVNEPGTLIWTELVSAEPDRVIPFYRSVFDWTPDAQDYGGTTYTAWQSGAKIVGNLRKPDAATEPQWLPYFAVADPDAAVRTVTELGGAVGVPATDTPAGRMAVVQDPQGATFAVIGAPG